jgi:choline dehydrogenase-like flavoprotein
MHEVIVVGSGASGVAATLAFTDRGVRPLVVDVGLRRKSGRTIGENIYDYRRRHDTFDILIGERFEGLANMTGRSDVPVKLTSPFARYVTQGAEEIAPIDETGFTAVQSFAAGGLANAWGAGLYRFTEEDLDGFPIGAADLDPHFDRLTDEIGISGEEDDLAQDFGSTGGLLPPLRLSRNITQFYASYRRKRAGLDARIRIGRARVAALTEPRDGRPVYPYHSSEFFEEIESLYSPRYTLDRLIKEDRIDFEPGVVVESWKETETGIRVEGRRADGGAPVSFEAASLVLAAGAINTSKIVLRSHQDPAKELELLENPALQFPLVLPSAIGRALDTNAFGLVQLNLVWRSPQFRATVQGSIMEITAPLRAEFFADLPYAARSNLALIRRLLPAMLVMQLFFPGSSQPPAKLSLDGDGRLRIRGHANELDLSGLSPLLKYLRRLGAWTFRRFVVRVPTGHAVHYASTLPMRPDPAPYQCDPRCRLHGTRRVYIGDSAAFTRLPAKNMSFAMMANAMRVAHNVVEEVRS